MSEISKLWGVLMKKKPTNAELMDLLIMGGRVIRRKAAEELLKRELTKKELKTLMRFVEVKVLKVKAMKQLLLQEENLTYEELQELATELRYLPILHPLLNLDKETQEVKREIQRRLDLSREGLSKEKIVAKITQISSKTLLPPFFEDFRVDVSRVKPPKIT
jgi:phosphoribosylformylglycinamidine (FGAM) synthase PurS component